MLLLISGAHALFGPFTENNILEQTILYGSAIASVAASLGSIIYWDIYRRNIEITIEGLRLNYTRGVIRKSTGSLVLRSHNLVQLFQRPLDRFFNVWEVQVYASNQPNVEFALIPGLTREDGYDLLRFFTSEFSKQVTVQERKTEP
jgi:hypothetical protein